MSFLQTGEDVEPDQSPACEYDFTPSVPRYAPAPHQPDNTSGRQAQSVRAKQRGLGFDGEVLKETIVRKLLDAGLPAFAHPLQKCHTEQFVKRCNDCRRTSTYYNRCEVFYCPCCASRLASDRRNAVEWWTTQIKQPKHVVLTVRNSEEITPSRVAWFKRCWAALRRRKFAKHWKGGFYSIEVTNEGKGWHLHLHALIDATYIDASRLATEWAKVVCQDFAIVYVKDARNQSFLKELLKYVVKGNQLASWSPSDVGAFVLALKGQRTFGTFGTLYKLRAEFRAFLDSVQSDKNICPCGCREFRIFSEQEWEWFEATNGKPSEHLNVQSRGTTSPNSPNTPEFAGF